MKRYLFALGMVFAMLLSTTPAAAGEPVASKDQLGLPSRHEGTIWSSFWWFQAASKVEQSNDNESGDATAINKNNTDQSNDQKQLGVGGDAVSGPASSDGSVIWCDKAPRAPQTKGDAYTKQEYQYDKKDGHCADGASTGKAIGGDVDQGQSASNDNATRQQASASSEAKQVAPINANLPIRILSFGDDKVEQSNDNESGDATAINKNNTDQSNDQAQYGFGGNAESGPATSDDTSSCGCNGHGGDASTGDAYGGDVSQYQHAGNSNSTSQQAAASSEAKQILPINVNAPIRILSFGDDKVEQSNDNESGDATAVNYNNTDQSNDQTQYGFGGDAESGAATSGDGSSDCGCKSDGGDASTGDAYGGDVSQSQDAGNSNSTDQQAEASSKAVQVAPVNANSGINLLGLGGLAG